MSGKPRFNAGSRFTNEWVKRENSLEDQNISRYEKLLGIKRKRRKNPLSSKLPQSFVNDGLDYILGVLHRDSGAEKGEDSNEEVESDNEFGHDDNSEDSGEDRKVSKKKQTKKKPEEKLKANRKNKAKSAVEVDEASEDEQDDTDKSPRKRVRFTKKLENHKLIHSDKPVAQDSEEKQPDAKRRRKESPEQESLQQPSTSASKIKRPLPTKEVTVSDRLTRLVRAALNRLSVSNLAAILSQLDTTVLQSASFSRAEIVQCIIDSVLDACALARRNVLERIALDYAVLVAALHGRGGGSTNIGDQLAARLVERLCHSMNAIREKLVHRADQSILNESEDEDRCKLLNATQFLCALLHLRVVHNVLIFGVIRRYAESFSEVEIDAILLVMRRCGIALRKDNPTELKTFLETLDAKQRTADSASDQSVVLSKRARVLLELIAAVKNNNYRKVPGYTEGAKLVEEYLSALRRVGARVGEDELHVTYDDFLAADERGRWWLVGSSWNDNEPQKNAVRKAGAADADAEADKIDAASRKLRLNTDVRKQLFRLLVTAEDAEDAFIRVTQFASARKATSKTRVARCRTIHEAIRLTCTCAMRERKHNPFYSQLVTRLASNHRTYRRYTLLVFWDYLRSMQLDSATWLSPEDAENDTWLQATDGDGKTRRLTNLACLLVALFKSGALSISQTLKPVEFAEMQPAMLVFLRNVFMRLLELDEMTCARAFAPLTDETHADKLLRDAISMFLNHFMRKPAKQHGRTELVERIKFVTEQVLVTAN